MNDEKDEAKKNNFKIRLTFVIISAIIYSVIFMSVILFLPQGHLIRTLVANATIPLLIIAVFVLVRAKKA